MTLETFFEKFDQFAEAPNAVAKMRELVLQLAVQGKLCEQNDDDQNDSTWRQLAEKLYAKNRTDQPKIDPPFNIPNSWRWVTLNDLGDTKPRNDVRDPTKCSFVPMTLIPARYGGTAQHEERTWGDVKKGYTHFKNGDVVMAKITPCFENGKSAVMDRLTGGIGAGTTELHVFRSVSDAVRTQYVLIYLKSRGFIDRGILRMTGSAGQKRVPHDYFASSPFPLPPPAEQRRIVAKVDQLMALVDQWEAQLAASRATATSLMNAVVAELIEGA